MMNDAPAPDRAEQARAYEGIHNWVFVARIGITVALIALYLFSGASAELAEGLRQRFGDAWWWTNAVYLLVTLFAFSAVLFPLSLYSDHYLEHRYALSHQSLNSWLWDHVKSLVIELAFTVAFLSVIYALLYATPQYWWIWATGVYVLLSIVLSALYPVWIMPLFNEFTPLPESDLTAAVRTFATESGLKVLGVFSWGLEEKTATANAALTGLGRTRRIILGDTMLKGYSQEEIIAVLAHEVGHYKHRDMTRLMIIGAALAFAGFFVVHLLLQALVAQFGFTSIADIGAFPLFIVGLFVFSLLTMPLSNAYSRKREYAADAYAVQAIGSAEPLVRALEKLAEQNLADKEPKAWIEALLHSHPSIHRRIAAARAAQEV